MSARPDRMPKQPTEELTEAQRRAVEAISSGPRGDVFGPFVPLLRSPEAMAKVQEVGAFLRFTSTLDRAVLELTILQVARHRDQAFEWGYHCPLALKEGVPESVVRAVAAGQEPADLAEPLATSYLVVQNALTSNEMSDELYQRAIDVLGPESLIDVLVTTGYYTTLAMVMNAAQTDASTLNPPIAQEPR